MAAGELEGHAAAPAEAEHDRPVDALPVEHGHGVVGAGGEPPGRLPGPAAPPGPVGRHHAPFAGEGPAQRLEVAARSRLAVEGEDGGPTAHIVQRTGVTLNVLQR